MTLVIKTKAPERIELDVDDCKKKYIEASKKKNLLSDSIDPFCKPNLLSDSIGDGLSFTKQAENKVLNDLLRYQNKFDCINKFELLVDKHYLFFGLSPTDLAMRNSPLAMLLNPTLEERLEQQRIDDEKERNERVAESIRQIERNKEAAIELQVEALRRFEEEKQKANQSQKQEWLESISYEIGFYVKNNTAVDWEHWLLLKEWSKEQAANLICGIDPNNDDSNVLPKPVTKIIQRCYDELKRDYAPPFVWLRWFDSVGLLCMMGLGRMRRWYNEKELELKEFEKLQELSAFKELVHNGESPVNWQHWAILKDITPEQAAKLANYIDPNEHKGKQFAQGDYSNDSIVNRPFKELNKRLTELEQRLRNVKSFWTLSELVEALGDDAPLGMVEAVNDLVQYLATPPLVDSSENQTTTPQNITVSSEETTRISKSKERDNDFKSWIELEKPPLDKMKKPQIHSRLIERNRQ